MANFRVRAVMYHGGEPTANVKNIYVTDVPKDVTPATSKAAKLLQIAQVEPTQPEGWHIVAVRLKKLPASIVPPDMVFAYETYNDAV